MPLPTTADRDPDEEDQPFISDKDEAAELHEQHRVLLQSNQKLRRWTVALAVLLVLAVVALTVELAALESGPVKTSSPIPPIPTKQVAFEQNELFAGELSAGNDEAWGTLMPPGDGFVVIDNPRGYNLPPGKATEQGEVYDISVFHQLHCLANIRYYLYSLKDAVRGNSTQRTQQLVLAPEQHHVHHCFDYIRQALMCAGDMTVEWPREEADGARFAVDGWGVEHQCKDWSSIMEYMAENDVVARLWD